MGASQSLIHGVRSPLRADMVHLCSGCIVHNYLLGPRIVLDPICGSYTILLRCHPKDCAIDITGGGVTDNILSVTLILYILSVSTASYIYLGTLYCLFICI